MRTIPWVVSRNSTRLASSSGSKKLGQPQPESNFASERKSGAAQQMQRYVPFKRLATCEEIAWWVTLLVSPAGDYVTGQVITVDGGKELWGDWWPIPDPPDLPPLVIPREPWETED